ncbi:MAG: glycoside hydrolase family 28 protein, partial [Chitinophagaceae bacterium]
CTMLSGHGGVVIGSEMSGDIRKITISNCVFDGTERGIRIKTARGRGGIVEEIRVSNIIMKEIRDQAIVLDMQYAKTNPEPVSERTPRFRNIHFSNITGKVNQAAFINGIEEMPIDNISFNDINLDSKTGFTINNASKIEFHNVTVNTEIGPSIKANKVNYLIVDGVKTFSPIANSATIDLKDVTDAFIYNAFPIKSESVYLRLSGAETKNITLGTNNFRNLKNPVKKEDEVTETVAKID